MRTEQLRDQSDVNGIQARGHYGAMEESKSSVGQSKASFLDLTDSNVAINYLEEIGRAHV